MRIAAALGCVGVNLKKEKALLELQLRTEENKSDDRRTQDSIGAFSFLHLYAKKL